jgi:hypothetical protein
MSETSEVQWQPARIKEVHDRKGSTAFFVNIDENRPVLARESDIIFNLDYARLGCTARKFYWIRDAEGQEGLCCDCELLAD